MNEESLSLVSFFRQLTAAFHLYPVLRRSRFLSGEMDPVTEVKDVSWIDANGAEMTPETWDSDTTRCFGMLLDGRGQVYSFRTGPIPKMASTRSGFSLWVRILCLIFGRLGIRSG